MGGVVTLQRIQIEKGWLACGTWDREVESLPDGEYLLAPMGGGNIEAAAEAFVTSVGMYRIALSKVDTIDMTNFEVVVAQEKASNEAALRAGRKVVAAWLGEAL